MSSFVEWRARELGVAKILAKRSHIHGAAIMPAEAGHRRVRDRHRNVFNQFVRGGRQNVSEIQYCRDEGQGAANGYPAPKPVNCNWGSRRGLNRNRIGPLHRVVANPTSRLASFLRVGEQNVPATDSCNQGSSFSSDQPRTIFPMLVLSALRTLPSGEWRTREWQQRQSDPTWYTRQATGSDHVACRTALSVQRIRPCFKPLSKSH
jgi:hypothetical protein